MLCTSGNQQSARRCACQPARTLGSGDATSHPAAPDIINAPRGAALLALGQLPLIIGAPFAFVAVELGALQTQAAWP